MIQTSRLRLRHTLPPAQAKLEPRPKQLYGVNRETIASVLFTTNALPGDTGRWSPLFERFAPSYESEMALSALAAIPFRDYPEHGRREIEALIIAKAKLSTWLATRGRSVVQVLAPVPAERNANEHGTVTSQGRPHKPAWPRIVQLVRQFQSDHPEWQKKRLAFEA
jgi:hypothetical protein